MRRANKRSPLNTGRMERFLKANGISGAAYRTWTGNQTLKEFIAMNPGWTQRKWEELVLENIALLRRNG